LTSGSLAFAVELRGAGHTVHTPDLYDGHTFAQREEGIGYARQVGFDTVLERGPPPPRPCRPIRRHRLAAQVVIRRHCGPSTFAAGGRAFGFRDR